MNLKDLRDSIDVLDARILALVNERMEKAILTSALKSEVEDKDRESEVLEKAKRSARCLLDHDFAEKFAKAVIGESKRLQALSLKTVGFQGEHGAYSEVAAKTWDDKAASIPCREFSDVFDSVEDGLFDFGIVPVENTLGGLIGPVNSILTYTDLHVVAAVSIPINHCLLVLPGTDHREIRSAFSHSQALSQCRHFLIRNKLDPLPYYDTAGAAKMLAYEKPKGSAAIASRLCADIYDLEILKEDIQDSNLNRTRFFVLSRMPSPEEGNMCSVVFTTEHKAGALFQTLEIFAREGINLTRIESVPNKPGDYAIFIDFEGSIKEERVQRALNGVAKETVDFRLLGCYVERKI
jgi:prephenate dehydratase/chorismate mutase